MSAATVGPQRDRARLMPLDDHTPRGHAARYTPECYAGMRDDRARTEAYRCAVAAAVAGKVVLDIGTGALALLSIIAAEAGAKHVYAIEVQPGAAEAARRAIVAAGHAETISVIEGFSTDEHVRLPVKAELMIHELIGEIAGEEGAVCAVLDAARRHMAPDAPRPFSIPSRSRTMIAPCEAPNEVLVGSARALKIYLPRDQLLASPQCCEDLLFAYGEPKTSQRYELIFAAARSGQLAGFVMHVELHCHVDAADAPPDVSSAWSGSHWRHVMLTLDEGVGVVERQKLRVHVRVELGAATPVYEFEAWADEAPGHDQYRENSPRWRSLGPPQSYPQASLNCNDMMDHLMAA